MLGQRLPAHLSSSTRPEPSRIPPQRSEALTRAPASPSKGGRRAPHRFLRCEPLLLVHGRPLLAGQGGASPTERGVARTPDAGPHRHPICCRFSAGHTVTELPKPGEIDDLLDDGLKLHACRRIGLIAGSVEHPARSVDGGAQRDRPSARQ